MTGQGTATLGSHGSWPLPAPGMGSVRAALTRPVALLLALALVAGVASWARLARPALAAAPQTATAGILTPRALPPTTADPVLPTAPVTAAALEPAAREAIDATLYAARPGSDGAARVTNHVHGLSASLGAQRATVTADGGSLTLALAGIGRGGLLAPAPAAGPARLAGSRVTIARMAGPVALEEWWINAAAGLEQGFTIASRPAGEGELRLAFDLGGSLSATLADERTLDLGGPGGGLRYEGLAAFDAAGRTLAARLELAGARLAIVVDDRSAVYPLTIDPRIVQQAYLKASNTGGGDWFGSVAISGDTIVVGATKEDSAATGVNGNQADDSAPNAGAAYVFVRSGTTWRQQAYLKASNTGAGDNFGWWVAISGNTIVVGAWGEDSAAKGVNGNQADNSIEDAGAAYVFTRTGTKWRQQAYLKASNPGTEDWFGTAVAIAGGTIVVGAPGESSTSNRIDRGQSDNTAPKAGAAYVFTRSGTTWRQQAYLKALNSGADDQLGSAVAISGGTVVVGAPNEDSRSSRVNRDQSDNSAERAGAAYVFVRNGTTWRQQAYLKASNTDAGDEFGYAVAMSGSTVVVGARLEASAATGVNGDQSDDSAAGAGAAYVFVRDGTAWRRQAYLKASNTGANDRFGASLAITGNTIVVGAWYEDSAATGVNGDQADNSAESAGAAYVFTRRSTTWRQQAYLKASNTGGAAPGDASGDEFGSVLAISGTTIVSGAYLEDSTAIGVNPATPDDNDAADSGSSYVLVIDGTRPVVTAPVARVRTGIALPAQGGLPLRWTWKGSDPRGSGIDRYEFQSRLPGGTWAGTTTADPRFDFDASSGVAGQERVRAIDRAGNVGAWAVGPVFTARLVEQTASSVKYTGPWVTQVDATWYSGGSTRYTERRGASATYTFTGRSIALVSTLAPTQGRYRIFVDGRLNRTVDLFADTFTSKMIVWQKTWSTRARHTVKIVAEGTSGRPWVDLDALVVLQ